MVKAESTVFEVLENVNIGIEVEAESTTLPFVFITNQEWL